MIAKARDLDARLFAGLQQRQPRIDRDFLAVDNNCALIHQVCPRAATPRAHLMR